MRKNRLSFVNPITELTPLRISNDFDDSARSAIDTARWDDDILYVKESHVDIDGREHYKEACEKLRVLPLNAVQEQLHSHDPALILKQYKLGPKGGIALGAAISHNAFITVLDLTDNGLGDDGCAAIADGVRQSKSITGLNLSSNACGRKGAEAIGRIFEGNDCKLSSLSLGGNRLRDHGIRILADSMKNANCLTELDLSDTCMGDTGVRALSSCLRSHRNLIHINISYNRFVWSTVHLCEALEDCIALRILDISHNPLGRDGGVALASMISSSSRLQVIDVSHSGLKKDACLIIADAIFQNPNLQTVICDHNAGNFVLEETIRLGDVDGEKPKCVVGMKGEPHPLEQNWDIEFDSDEVRPAVLGCFETAGDHEAENSMYPRCSSPTSRFDDVWTKECEAEMKLLLKNLSATARASVAPHMSGTEADHPYSRASSSYPVKLSERAYQFREAFEVAESLLQSNPKNLAALTQKGLALKGMKRFYDAAMSCIQGHFFDCSDPSLENSFQSALQRLRLDRPHFLPPPRKVTIKIRSLEKEDDRPMSPLPEVEPGYVTILERLRDLFSVSNPRADDKGLRLLLRRFNSTLRDVFKYYSRLDRGLMTQNGDEMNIVQFWSYLKDSKFVSIQTPIASWDRLLATCKWDRVYSSIHSWNRTFHYFEFVEGLIRISHELYGKTIGRIPDRFITFIESHLVITAKKESSDKVGRQVSEPSVYKVLERFKSKLIKTYQFFAATRGASSATGTRASAVGTGTRQSTIGLTRTGSSPGTPTLPPPSTPGNPLPPTPESATQEMEGARSGSASPASTPQLPQSRSRLSVLGTPGLDEGDSPMNYNDLLNMVMKLDLLNPQVNMKKLHQIGVAVLRTTEGDLLPQIHPNNNQAEIIVDEFCQILCRMSLVLYKDQGSVASAMETYLKDDFFPKVGRVIKGRL
eukprot:Rmarinus@m.23530